MAYIGRDTDKISNVEVLDNITFDGSSSYTLQKVMRSAEKPMARSYG